MNPTHEDKLREEFKKYHIFVMSVDDIVDWWLAKFSQERERFMQDIKSMYPFPEDAPPEINKYSPEYEAGYSGALSDILSKLKEKPQ